VLFVAESWAQSPKDVYKKSGPAVVLILGSDDGKAGSGGTGSIITAEGKVEIKASQDISAHTDANLEIKATGNGLLETTGPLDIKSSATLTALMPRAENSLKALAASRSGISPAAEELFAFIRALLRFMLAVHTHKYGTCQGKS